MNKTAIWKGEDRVLPGIGHMTSGKRFTAPLDVVDSLMEQGLAEVNEPAPAPKQSVRQENKS